MKIIYRADDGKEFSIISQCEKHESNNKKLKQIFYKLVDENFFENYKIPKFFHNFEVTNLGKPSKNNWIERYHGYVLVHGRYGNGNTIISFKLRKNKLLIFQWDTDDSESEGKKYLGSVNIDEPRRIKLEKIINKIKEEIKWTI